MQVQGNLPNIEISKLHVKPIESSGDQFSVVLGIKTNISDVKFTFLKSALNIDVLETISGLK